MSSSGGNIRKAIALKYDPAFPAPFVVAKGKQELADRLIRLAREHGVKIIEESELSNMLFEIEPDSFVPEEMYEIIAQLLAYVFETRKQI